MHVIHSQQEEYQLIAQSCCFDLIFVEPNNLFHRIPVFLIDISKKKKLNLTITKASRALERNRITKYISFNGIPN